MRKVVVICDRCGAEIDGTPAGISVLKRTGTYMSDPMDELPASDEEIKALFDDPTEGPKALKALSWDYCGECTASILRKAAGITKATIKAERLPSAPKATRGRKVKSSDADEMERDRSDRIEKKRRTEK